ncbi:hypothetical protein [Solibacillus sp. NPDC093137]|uniref:hypothetical protein n=1 Tax=Solibacillus sp. NPDC093137 TaxID=3390678 RepID=UPI003D0119AF
MKKMKVYYNEQCLYDSLYYLQHDIGIRGQVYSYFYDNKGRLTERNNLGDFLITTECAVHFNFEYQFNARIPYTMAFDYLKQSLVKAAANESVLDLDATLHKELTMYFDLTYPDSFTIEEVQLTNMDNLSYLFEHMMRYNCSPTLTTDFLSKLILIEPEISKELVEQPVNNEESVINYEENAFEIMKHIKGIIASDNVTDDIKRDMLEIYVAENISIFENYEKSLKE